MSSYAKAESATPFRFRVKDDVADGRHCKIVLYVQCDGMEEPEAREIVFIAENGVEIGGIIDHNATLEPGLNYILTRSLIVPEDYTLIIKPGTTIKVTDNTSIQVQGTLNMNGTPENPIFITTRDNNQYPSFYINAGNSVISYTKISCLSAPSYRWNVGIDNCTFEDVVTSGSFVTFMDGQKISNSNFTLGMYDGTTASQNYNKNAVNINFVNNVCHVGSYYGFFTADFFEGGNNTVGNLFRDKIYSLGDQSFDPRSRLFKSEIPSYFGSSDEKIVRKGVVDIENLEYPGAIWKFDLSNMLTRPNPGAHGIVWKVCVNGYDAQNEFNQLPPLGVGRHKFEVWYSKVIDHGIDPVISMGVRPPYTQTTISKDGSWRKESVERIDKSIDIVFRDITFDNDNDKDYLSTEGFNNPEISIISDKNNSPLFTQNYLSVTQNQEQPLSGRVYANLGNIFNGPVHVSFLVSVNKFDNDRRCQYVYANDKKIILEKAEPTYYEFYVNINERHPLVIGYEQMEGIASEICIDDIHICLSDEVSVYTAYLDIKGGMAIDGLNRIRVEGAQDLEYFDIPLEYLRFNVEVSAAGSMSTGFFATPGIGKVDLEWEDLDMNIEDIMGYNLYRISERETTEWGYDENWNWVERPITVIDTVRINQRLIEQPKYTDFDVVPGQRYDYYYKVMRTDMAETSPSKVVSVVPLTASKGDANGSLTVDVADVVTEISYMTGGNPEPFIFEAADVNNDAEINILDVVGTINIIVNPNSASIMTEGGLVKYWITDGILYMENDVTLGGVQFLFDNVEGVHALEALEGFETVNQNFDNQVIFMAYSMVGRTLAPGIYALVAIDGYEGGLESAVCSDIKGHNVVTMQADLAGMSLIEIAQMRLPNPNPFVDMINIPFVIGDTESHNVEIRFSDLTGRMIDCHKANYGYGEHNYTWRPSLQSGIYLASLYIDGKLVQTSKLVKR